VVLLPPVVLQPLNLVIRVATVVVVVAAVMMVRDLNPRPSTATAR
jgi:hypothetical protein